MPGQSQPHFEPLTGEFASPVEEAAFQADQAAAERSALLWGLAIGLFGVGLGAVSDSLISEGQQQLTWALTCRALTMLAGGGFLLLAARQADSWGRSALIATAEIAVAVGFLTVRAVYEDRGVPGAFLVSITGLLTGVFFFIPNRLRWQLATGFVVSALAIAGAIVVLGRPPRELVIPGVVYAVLVAVGWRLNRTVNQDRRRLYVRTQDAESAAERAEATSRTALALFRRAPSAMVVVAADDGRVLATNAAFERMVAAHDGAESVFDRMLQGSRGKVTGALNTEQREGPVSVSLFGPSNHSIELQARADQIDYHGEPALLLSLADVRPQRRRERELRDLAERDPLTGALNRRGFETAVDRALAQPQEVALMLVDVDRFKAINDRYGHPVGDGVLQAIVQDIQGLVRRDDLVGRLGGDEFAVLLVEVVPGMAIQVADRLRRIVGRDINPHTSISVGVVQRRADEPYSALFERADQQLYAAKARGGDQVMAGAG